MDDKPRQGETRTPKKTSRKVDWALGIAILAVGLSILQFVYGRIDKSSDDATALSVNSRMLWESARFTGFTDSTLRVGEPHECYDRTYFFGLEFDVETRITNLSKKPVAIKGVMFGAWVYSAQVRFTLFPDRVEGKESDPTSLIYLQPGEPIRLFYRIPWPVDEEFATLFADQPTDDAFDLRQFVDAYTKGQHYSIATGSLQNYARELAHILTARHKVVDPNGNRCESRLAVSVVSFDGHVATENRRL